jgi:hypothetical protein
MLSPPAPGLAGPETSAMASPLHLVALVSWYLGALFLSEQPEPAPDQTVSL